MLQPGQIINGRYRVERTLGAGGMADVYLVTHTRMRKQFALKVMRLCNPGRELLVERFEREVDVLATLKHPNIVAITDNDRLPDGNPYLVMEYLEGEDLTSFLARSAPLSIPVAMRLCGQIGDALLAAHQQDVVHRDLKPGNIFLCKHGASATFVKVLDFGIAKVTQLPAGKSSPTKMGLMGTPAYMSPEQARSQHELIDARSDQFALAVILYEMLTGRHPFVSAHDEGDLLALLHRIVSEDPPPLGIEQPQIERVLRRALSKDPAARFPSLREFMGAIGASTQTVFQAMPALLLANTTGVRSGELQSAQPPPGRRFWLAFAGGAAAMGLLSALLFRLPSHAQRPPRLPPGPPAVADLAGQPTSVSDGAVDDESLSSTDLGPAADLAESSPSPPDPVDPSPPRRARSLSFSLRGKLSRPVEQGIRVCLDHHVARLAGLSNYVTIRLERSGRLKVTSAPQPVLQSSFNTCLDQALLLIGTHLLPQNVTIIGER